MAALSVYGKLAIRRHFQLPLRYSYKNSRSSSGLTTQANKKYFSQCKQCIYGVSTIFPRIKKFIFVNSQTRTMSALSPMDPSSHSRPELALLKHINFTIDVDFEKKVLHVIAVIRFEVLDAIKELILDSSELNIESIELIDGTPLKFQLVNVLANFGSKLCISLPKSYHTEDEGQLRIEDKEILKIVSNNNSRISSSFSESFFCNCQVLKEISFTEDSIFFEKIESDHTYHCISVKPIGSNSDEGVSIKIKYTTSPKATGLQWLDPNQTMGKVHPYFFSQCQPIHARSIFPCQDTPSVKFTYDAEVTAPEEFTVLMGALRDGRRGNVTVLRQPMPIPSYLFCIAVGVLERHIIGARCHLWGEKELIERSAWELAETEMYVEKAERICGAYQWTQCDLLVLPPSFPFGGMENACLTFVTPTLLAGDRSLVDVMIHEIIHSWTGNLVTSSTFEDFWLNEGFTVFLERKVSASLIEDPVEAKRSRDFHSLLGLQELRETISTLGESNPITQLVPNLAGVHPDDAFSIVPYEKGSLFLRYLEDTVGGPVIFEDFVRSYINCHQHSSLNTSQFKSFITKYFSGTNKLRNVDWNAWLHKPGMPPVIPNFDMTMTKAITELVNKIETEDAEKLTYDDIMAFTPYQVIKLLQDLIDRDPLPLDKVRALGEAYKLPTSTNCEILYRWSRICIRSRDEGRLADVFKFVNSLGRMKYVRPIYRDLYAWEAVRERAIENFLKNEPNMMHVSAYTLRKDLHLNE